MEPLIKIIIANRISNLQTQNGPQASIDGPILTMSLPFVPSAASFSVLIMLANLSVDEEYRIRLTFYSELDPKNLLFDSGETILGPFRQTGMMEIDNLNLDMLLQNIPIFQEGKHIIEVSVNGIIKKESFIINHRPIEREKD